MRDGSAQGRADLSVNIPVKEMPLSEFFLDLADLLIRP
jgi:hypothetical protein